MYVTTSAYNLWAVPVSLFGFELRFIFKASRGAGAQNVPVNRLVLGSIPTRGDEIFIYIYIFISSLWSRGESAALSSATQHAMPPEIGRKW